MKDKKKWRKKVLAFALAMLTFTGIFFENSVMTQAENKEEKTENYIKVYYLLYDGQEENVFSNFMVKSPCKILEDGTIRSVINSNPEVYDYNANGITLDVDINRGKHWYGQVPITEECIYNEKEGYIDIPGKYLGKDLTVTVWQFRDSAFYTNLVPDELKPQKDRRGNISFYTFQDNFPSGTIPVLFEPKGCNIVTLHGDINTVKVGDIWNCNADTWYVADKYNADSYIWEDVAGCKEYDKGFSQGQIVSIKDCENPMFNNIGGAGPEGKNWMFMGCLSSVNNTFQGVPVITKMYIECIAKEGNTATFFVHAACKGPKGQKAQTIGGFFKASFSPPWIEVYKKPTTDKTTWIDGDKFQNGYEWAQWAISDNPAYDLSGAKYTLWSYETGEYFHECIITDANGYGWCYVPYTGKFMIKEVYNPKGYILDDQWHDITITENNATFYHDENVKYAQLRLHKSSETATDKSLAGAKYGVWNWRSTVGNGKPDYIITTDENGYGEVNDIPLWYYYIQEIEAPEGFGLDKTIYEANCTDAGTYPNVGVDLYSQEPLDFGKITLKKQSANPDCTEDNPVYSLKGAEYSIYSNPECTNYVDKMITDESGYAEKDGLQLGTYYVKESKAPQGYHLDETVYKVSLPTSSGELEYQVTSTEMPQLEQIKMLLEKIDKDTGEPIPTGQGSLKGAEFVFKFYKGEYPKDTNPETLGKTVDKTWIFATNEKGVIEFDESFLIRGDSFYIDDKGEPVLSVGTLVITEKKAPEGYHINPITIIKNIRPEGVEDSEAYVTPEIAEDSISVKIIKVQDGTNVHIPGTVFRHTMPNGTTKDYATDDKGEVQLQGLRTGKHQIVELSPAEGYLQNTSVFEFEVTADNKVHALTKLTEDMGIAFAEEKNGDGTLTVKNKLAPFKLNIHKVNNKDKVLEGAEFTLYEDKDCSVEVDRQVSDKDGNLAFENIQIGREYYLKETKAPAGYKLPIHPDGSPVIYKIKVESDPIKNNFIVYVNDKAYDTNSDGAITIGGTKKDREVNLTVVNTVNGKLPNTGAYSTSWILAMGSILILAALKNKEKRIK
jgi:LPXTG-motif cell wall-anchored protein